VTGFGPLCHNYTDADAWSRGLDNDKERGGILERTEMRMSWWIHGVSVKDKKWN